MGAVVDTATSGPLVGRSAELSTLADAIGRAAEGRTRVVAISGEAGIGKLRLAQEALRSAGTKGFRTLEGAAGRLYRDLSYAPIVEALRPLVAEAALVDGLSDLARLFDGLGVPPVVALGDPGLERTRMFEAVRVLIERASMRQPQALLIEDLHWADPGTLALLLYVVRALPRQRCLFLVTYSADKVGEELRELVTALQRAETLTMVELTGLDAAAVGDLAAVILDGPTSAALQEMLVRRSGGVPLFVRAIVLRLIETGMLVRAGGRWVLGPAAATTEIPALVSTLLLGKIEALPPAPRRVLDVLAVCGGAAEDVLLHDVADDLVDGITGLRSAGLAVEDTRFGGLRYQVTHPMLAEAAYELVPVVARRRLHALLADAVERHRPDDVRVLAAHVRGAGDQIDPARALDVLTAATRAELARLAGEEACASARTALDIARRLGRLDAVHELSGAYAEACELAGRVQDALPAWLDAADSAADPGVQARRLTRAAVIAWDLGRLDDAHGYLDAADRALAAVPPCPERVDIEGTRMRFASRAGDPDALRDSIARLEGLPATSSSRSRAALLSARLRLALFTGRYVDGLGVADAIVAFAHEDRSVLVADTLLPPLISIRVCWGDLAGARALAEEAIQLARQTGVPSLEIAYDALLALVEGLAGRWPAALRLTFDALEFAHRVGVPRVATMALTAQAMILVRRGDVDEAADRLSEARRLFGMRPEADRGVFAVIDLVEGMVALARHQVNRALDIGTGRATQGATFPPLALALLGEAQAAAGDAKAAFDTASALAALGPGAPYPAALAAWVSGLAAGARRDPSRAVAALGQLDRAVTGFAELGMPYEEAIARLDRAPVRRAAGHAGDDIAREVADVLRVLDRLPAKPQADRARSLLRELGQRPAPAPRDESRQLSAREEEVARLVALGLSNAEVAQRLFISTRTVTTHLQHIYRRLDVPSRAVLIRYVLDAARASKDTSRGGVDT